MPDCLTVHVNRAGLHSLDAPESFAAEGSFDVVVENHGGATHVHLRADGALSDEVAIEGPNHHVAGGVEHRVRVTRTGEGPVSGALKVVTAHGSHTSHVDVHLGETDGTGGPVVEPERASEPGDRTGRLGGEEWRALAVGGAAVLALGATAGAVAESLGAAGVVVVLGVCGVVAAVAVNRAT